MSRLLVHLPAVGVGIAKDVASKFYHHHLHTQADAEGGDIVCAGVVGRHYLPFDATLSEARTDNDTIYPLELILNDLLGDTLGIDELEDRFYVVVSACL